MINSFDDVKFEAASVLAELYEQQKQLALSKPILRKAIELSQHNVYWHCRLIFQLAVSTYKCSILMYLFCNSPTISNAKNIPYTENVFQICCFK